MTVLKHPIKNINWQKQEIILKGGRTTQLLYDKLLIAWGSHKKRLKDEYSNVYYLEDRVSHQRCTQDMLRAKTVVILGGTMDAYQTACSVRE